MIVDDVIARIQAIDPQPFGLVEGMGALAALAGSPPTSPAAYVFEKESAASPNERLTGVLQRIEVDIAVVVVVTDLSDPRSAAAGSAAAPIERAVLTALLGWQPDGAGDVVTFVGAVTVKARGGEIWRELTFATAYYEEA